jgi:hypothetical protein
MSTEPGSAAAAMALRFVEKTFGTNHSIANEARHELHRIQALEKTPDKPMHEAIGDVAFKLDKLTTKMEHQRDLMAQAVSTHHQAGERVSELAANIQGTQTDISQAQAERHNLLAACHLSTKQNMRISSGPDALEHFLQGAGGLVDPHIINTLRQHIAAIDVRMQNTTRPPQLFKMASSGHSDSRSQSSGRSTPRSEPASDSLSETSDHTPSLEGNLTHKVKRTAIHLQMALSAQQEAKEQHHHAQTTDQPVAEHNLALLLAKQKLTEADQRVLATTEANTAAKLAVLHHTAETGSGRPPIPPA